MNFQGSSANNIQTPRGKAATSWRGRLWHLAKLGLALGLIWLLWRWGFLDMAPLQRVLDHPGLVALSVALITCGVIITSFRLFLLVRGVGMTVGWLRCLALNYAGFIANFFLPGGSGGDAVRLAYLAAANPAGMRIKAVAPMLLDRLLGLLGILIVAGLALPLWLLGQERSQEFHVLAWLALGGLAVLLIGLVVGLALVGPLQRRLQGWSAPEVSTPKRMAWQILAAFAVYRERRRILVICLGISCVNHVLGLSSLVIMAQAASSGALGWLDYALVGVFTLVANTLPLTPGGLGVGEGVFAHLCDLLAPAGALPGAGSAFLAFRCVMAITFLPGVFAHIFLLKK